MKLLLYMIGIVTAFVWMPILLVWFIVSDYFEYATEIIDYIVSKKI